MFEQDLAEDHLTAFFVTHNLNETAKLSHRVAVIVKRMLRHVGTVKAFLQELPQ